MHAVVQVSLDEGEAISLLLSQGREVVAVALATVEPECRLAPKLADDDISKRRPAGLGQVEEDDWTLRRHADCTSSWASSRQRLVSGRLRTSRRPGLSDPTSLMRKGVAGDWVNYLSPADKAAYKQSCGRLLIDLGYAADDKW